MAILPQIGLGISDELRNALNWKRWIHLHDLRHADNARDRRGVANEIEVERFKQRCVDRGVSSGKEERVTVSSGPNGDFGADVGPAACTILNETLLTETL